MASMKFLLLCLVALVAIQFSSAEIDLVLTQNVVKSQKHIPAACFQAGQPCGNMTTFFSALQIAREWFDVPDPPVITDPKDDARRRQPPVDYHMCNYTNYNDKWVMFPWGDQLQYVHIIDGLKYINCLWGMCDDQVYFGGYKYGCVGVWNTRTFLALWYKKNKRAATRTRCFNRWCFVNIKITYPESCKCAQLFECEAPWAKK